MSQGNGKTLGKRGRTSAGPSATHNLSRSIKPNKMAALDKAIEGGDAYYPKDLPIDSI
jgi:hypothetical protein